MTITTPLSSDWLCLHPADNQKDDSYFSLSLDNRGLAYGDGFFTTMGVIDGKVLWLDYHHQRLVSHAKALELKLDSSSLIVELQRHAQRLGQGMLKLIVTRAAQAVRGYGYTSSESGSTCEVWLKSSVMILTTDSQLRLADGRFVPMQPARAAVCLSSKIACLPPPLAGLKSLNRLDTVLASAELQRIKTHSLKDNPSDSDAGLDIGEGLVRDMSGHWVEGTMSNVFYQLVEEPTSLHISESHLLKYANLSNANGNATDYVTKGQWYTPPMTQSGVAGVMRQVIIDALSSTENPVLIRSLQDGDLPCIKRLFFCNALRGIMPMANLKLLSGNIVDFKSV